MADVIRGIRSLPLHNLIGSTLVAIVRADSEAAKATIEFIQTVGFTEPVAGGEGEQDEGDQLRLAKFRYQKRDENDQLSDFVALVPLLSLVPIPALQTKEAKLNFSAKITEITKEPEQTNTFSTASSSAGSTATVSAVRTPLLSRLQPANISLLAKPVAASGAKDKEIRGSFDLEIELTMGQADLPIGLEKIFNLMDQAIQDEKAGESQ